MKFFRDNGKICNFSDHYLARTQKTLRVKYTLGTVKYPKCYFCAVAINQNINKIEQYLAYIKKHGFLIRYLTQILAFCRDEFEVS